MMNKKGIIYHKMLLAYKSTICVFVIISLLLLGCTKEKHVENIDPYAPNVVEAKGLIVPRNSIQPPQIVQFKDVKRKPAGRPKVVQLQSHITPAGKLSSIDLGTPISICIPGQGQYKLPEILPAIDSSFIGGLPEIERAKMPKIIETDMASFRVYSTMQGLKNNISLSMISDRIGNIWIGTWGGGATKYDGRSFTHYSSLQGLSNDMVNIIFEDSNGNLWFGTYNGLNKYDGKSFTIFTTLQGLPGDRISGILEDENQNIWIGTDNGLAKYDGKTFTQFTVNQGLCNNWIQYFWKEKNGDLWIRSNNCLTIYDGESFTNYNYPEHPLGVIMNISENKSHEYSMIQLAIPEDLVINQANYKYNDERGNTLITSDNGIYKFDGYSFIHLGPDMGLNGANLAQIRGSKRGDLWIGSNGGGMAALNSQLFTHIRTGEEEGNSSLRSILTDQYGNIWVGFWNGGVVKLQGKSISRYTLAHGLSSNNITAICEDQQGNIWFGTWGMGVDKFDGKTFRNYSNVNGWAGNAISDIYCDSKGNLWFGTTGGVSKFNGETIENFTPDQGLSGNDVRSIIEDRDHNIWFGTFGDGLNKYDGKSFIHYGTSNGLNDMSVICMLEDKNGNLWFGTDKGGVNKFDGKFFTHYTVEQGLPNNNVTSLLEDQNGDIWLGTINGLSRMQLSNEKVLNQRTGLKSNVTSSLFKNYFYSDGFLGVGTWYNSLVLDKNGTIWVGAHDRITAIHPEEDIPDTIPPHIQLAGVSLFNEDINWLEVDKNKDTVLVMQNGKMIRNINFSSIAPWSYTPEQLELDYDNNYITFKFIGITTYKPERVKYQFMLDGLEENWSYVTSNPEATYTNLPFGDYIFKVKAATSEGYWSDTLSYSFIINPPWWFSGWAYGFYILIFIAGVRVVHVFQKRRVLRKEREKAQMKELEQAKEIEKAYTELKAYQSQLIQSEKMASLGELTAGIAHEIQNPLNFVNNFSEVNAELITELEEEIKNGNFDDIIAIAKSIKENEEKVKHHGKRAEAIVKGMLQHSRSSSGVKELTDINVLADEYLRLAYYGFRAKDKSFNAEYDLDLVKKMPKIKVIPQDIGRVLLNLINNAFYAVSKKAKANIEGYMPKVEVSTASYDDRIEIKVKDNGNGIQDNIKDKIFQPFFTTKPTGQGTGLGLSLSYDIIKAHGGEIKVETKSDEGSADNSPSETGTQFIIEIPIAR